MLLGQHHPWRTDGFLDAIVTDPPYGVRAGQLIICPTERFQMLIPGIRRREEARSKRPSIPGK